MLTVSVLGDLQLELDGKRLAPPARQSGRLLLGYLALRRGMHARGDLAELIWPEVLQSSARASLRSAIAAVRRTLGDDAERYLMRVGDTLGLAPADAGVSIDAERFDALVAAGDLARALELSRGPLLQGLDAEWVRQARAEHLDRMSDLLAALADEAERRGDLAAAVRYTRRQVALSPLAEPPNRELIRRLAAAGDRASAVAVYGNLAEQLRRELRTVPSPQTRRLLDEVRTGRSTASPLPLPAPLELITREPFVDRAPELERLAGALAGDVRCVVVAGEPGVGKSALVARFAKTAAASATVLLGRCRSAASMPLEPFVEALRRYVSGAPAELPAAAGELSGLIPELADRLAVAALPSDLLDDGGRVSRAILETLVAACRSGPLVLVIEDLHEADAATLELVKEIARRPDRAPLLLVATLRDTGLRRSSPLAQLTRHLRALPSTTYVTLEGLDAASVGQLATAVTGNEVAPDDARRLHARTNGNPFFATHLLEVGGSALPDRIQDLVWDEVSRLSADAQACLAVAATVGVEFDLATVSAVAGYGDDRTLDALDEAVLAHTARELPGAVGRYAFRHQLIRDTIYASQTATRRAHLHRRVAAVLGSEDPGSREVVDHLRRARELVPAAELAEQLARAARASEARRTHADAASLYSDAAGLVTDGARRSELLIALGNARRRAGASDDVVATFLDAAADGGAAGRTDLVVAAALGVCATPYFPGDRPIDRRVVALLEEALQTAPEPSVRARLLARLAGELTYDAARGRPDDIAGEAVALAREAGGPEALAAALDVAHLAFRGSGAPARRRELARAARASGRSETLVAAYVHETVAQVELGELVALEANADALARLADELRQPAFVWWAGLWRATAAIVRGALDDARELVQAAYGIGHAAFGESAELELRAQLAWIRIELGQLTELAGAIGELESAFSALPVWGSLRARVLAETGGSGQTEALVERALAALEWDTNWLVSAWLVAETLVRSRDVEQAKRLRTALAPRAEHWAVSARGTVCLGPVAGALSLLCAVEGRAEEAARYYELAQRRCDAAGARLAGERIAREYRLASADA